MDIKKKLKDFLSKKSDLQKIVVIYWPTASWKTALSIDIAKKIDSEIISTDSEYSLITDYDSAGDYEIGLMVTDNYGETKTLHDITSSNAMNKTILNRTKPIDRVMASQTIKSNNKNRNTTGYTAAYAEV